MSETENGHPPAPKKKGFWSRFTGKRGREDEDPSSDAELSEAQAASHGAEAEAAEPQVEHSEVARAEEPETVDQAQEAPAEPAPADEAAAPVASTPEEPATEAAPAEPAPPEAEPENPAAQENAPQKASFWSRLTGRRGREHDAATPEPAASEPEAAPHHAAEPESVELSAEQAPVAEPASEEPATPGPLDAAAETPEAPPSLTEPEPQEDLPLADAAPEEALSETDSAEETAPAKVSFWSRLKSGLSRTTANLTQGITDLVTKRKLDADTLEELEDLLLRADLGLSASARIVEQVGKGRHDKMIAPEEVKGLIADEVEEVLAPVAHPLVIDRSHKPFIILMVGVNGSGKTTTIGKLASQWRSEGLKVMLAAGDTFRAAAIEQLKVWGERTGASVIARAPGADAAGVAHDAITEARAAGSDVLLIDTAGRLQNRAELMAELEKVVRVIRKLGPSAPHAVLLVLDATVGQNALSQVEVFQKVAGVTGLVMTKLDGTARGGILVAIAEKYGLPVHLIGVGEGADDLQPFSAREFARAIAGLGDGSPDAN